MPTTPSERIGRCTRMRRFFVRFNRPESFVHTRSSAGFTIITSGFEFSVHRAFSMIMRLYWPKEVATEGKWKQPPLQQAA